MRTTDFEFRHRTLLSQMLIACGVLTYVFDPEDVVWRFIKDYPDRRELEHAIFLLATLFIGAGAVLCTRAGVAATNTGQLQTPSLHSSASQYWLCELLFSLGIGTLLPLPGFILLVAGQALRVLRLAASQTEIIWPVCSGWIGAIRREAAKWGLLLTMIVFTITLIDRVADYLAAASCLVWAAFNLRVRKQIEPV